MNPLPTPPTPPPPPELPYSSFWQRRYLRLLRHARRRVRRQQRRLLQLEVDGIVAVTLHSIQGSLTLAVDAATAAQLSGELWEVLHQRRRTLGEQSRAFRQAQAAAEAARSASPT